MSILRDEAGNPARYWPITGLAAGEESNTRVFKIDTPMDGLLNTTDDPNVRVIVSCSAAGMVEQDLALNPIDLSEINEGPDTEFEIYIRAVGPIVGLYRVPLAVGVGIASQAGWVEA
jgi:hypothetical protein